MPQGSPFDQQNQAGSERSNTTPHRSTRRGRDGDDSTSISLEAHAALQSALRNACTERDMLAHQLSAANEDLEACRGRLHQANVLIDDKVHSLKEHAGTINKLRQTVVRLGNDHEVELAVARAAHTEQTALRVAAEKRVESLQLEVDLSTGKVIGAKNRHSAWISSLETANRMLDDSLGTIQNMKLQMDTRALDLLHQQPYLVPQLPGITVSSVELNEMPGVMAQRIASEYWSKGEGVRDCVLDGRLAQMTYGFERTRGSTTSILYHSQILFRLGQLLQGEASAGVSTAVERVDKLRGTLLTSGLSACASMIHSNITNEPLHLVVRRLNMRRDLWEIEGGLYDGIMRDLIKRVESKSGV